MEQVLKSEGILRRYRAVNRRRALPHSGWLKWFAKGLADRRLPRRLADEFGIGEANGEACFIEAERREEANRAAVFYGTMMGSF